MARIAGVNIPTQKRVVIALQYIHGIGQKNAADILEKVKIPLDRRVNQLSDAEVLQIREVIDRDYLVEGDLRHVDLATVLDGVTHVFHLAAQAGVRRSWGSEFQVYTGLNVDSTQALLEALRLRGLESKFVGS